MRSTSFINSDKSSIRPARVTEPAFSHCRRRVGTGLAALAATGGVSVFAGAAATRAARTRFHLIGDTPYSPEEQQLLAATLPAVGETGDFLIHAGDIKSGIEHCSNELLASRLATLDSASCPLVLVPGDNEWTDCHRILAGSFAPMERLQWLRRQVFTAERGYTLGRGLMAIESQSNGRLPDIPLRPAQLQQNGLPENLRWSTANCEFVSLNIPGNRFGLTAGIAPELMVALATADLRWLNESLERAIGHQRPALVIAFHAEFRADKLGPKDFNATPDDAGQPYGWVRAALHRIVCLFPGTVVVLHGDRHQYRNDKPWEQLAQSALAKRLPGYGVPLTVRRERMARFTRLRSFGTPAAAAYVSVSIDSRPGQPVAVNVTPRLI